MLNALLNHRKVTCSSVKQRKEYLRGKEQDCRQGNSKPLLHRRRSGTVKNVRYLVNNAETMDFPIHSNKCRPPVEGQSLHMSSLSHWIPRTPHYDLHRVAYGGNETINTQRAKGDSFWSQALVIKGRVYFPGDLEFCQRVAAASSSKSESRAMGGGSLPEETRIHQAAPLGRSPTSPTNYKPVSPMYQSMVKEEASFSRNTILTLPDSTTDTKSPKLCLVNREELKQQFNYTILREQYRRFLEDMRTEHAQREEYDPTKPYYTRSKHAVAVEEYDPENPSYFST